MGNHRIGLNGARDHKCKAVIEDRIVRVWSSRKTTSMESFVTSTEIESFVGVVVLQVHHSIFIRQENFYGVVHSPVAAKCRLTLILVAFVGTSNL